MSIETENKSQFSAYALIVDAKVKQLLATGEAQAYTFGAILNNVFNGDYSEAFQQFLSIINMALPKDFNTLTNDQKEAALVKELQLIQKRESYIKKKLAAVRGGSNVEIIVDERPDLIKEQ